MNDKELLRVEAGAVNGTLIGAISKILLTVLEVGRSIGTALYSIKTGRKC